MQDKHMPKIMDTEKFINKARVIHGDRYDYSLVRYVNQKTKMIIICSIHGEFLQTPNNHIYSRQGCPECSGNNKLNTKSFIDKAKIIHDDRYDYSLVEYKNNKSKIEIICQKHGSFKQQAGNHIYKKYGCPKCKGDKLRTDQLMTNSEFINKAVLIHGNKYDYSIINYTGIYNKIIIVCPEHGEFEQIPHNHINGKGCPRCKSSKGEITISKFLIENNIKFESQKRFKDCRNKLPLPFDFYLTEQNICIEYNGKQHYEPIKHFGGEESFYYIQNNDAIKYKYCKDKSIRLIKIRFDDDVQDILNNIME